MVRLILPYPPSTNRMWRLARGRMVVSEEAKAYKRLAFVAAHQSGLVGPGEGPGVGDVAVCVVLHPVAPKKASKAKVRCIDTDNALKIALDALQGIAYANDSQVVEISAKRGEPVEGGALVVSWGKA
jgi:crossover junction endodeoxyribonuclease RusA